MLRVCVNRVVVAAVVFACISTARAEWEVVNLHPDGMEKSTAYATTGSEHGGQVDVVPGYHWYEEHASLWTGPGLSWVDIHPGALETWSTVYGMDGSQQVGLYQTQSDGSDAHAALWTGSSGSFVDLNPAGYSTSVAKAACGSYQAGRANVSGASHAGFWLGTADSFYDLHPGGAQASGVEGTTGLVHAGWTNYGEGLHASIWKPTLDGWLWFDRHEITGRAYSKLFDTNGVQHVGETWNTVSDSHAGLWSETGPTFTDLDPAWGGGESHAHALSQDFQVGSAFVGTACPHACLWRGTAASAWDLHSVLGEGYVASVAYDIHQSGRELWVVGEATSGQSEAMLWHYTPPASDPLAKFSQMPDPNGLDVAFYSAAYGVPNVLADDWRCQQTGPVAGIRFWVSWKGDDVGDIPQISVAICRDDAGKPGTELWGGSLGGDNFTVGGVEIGLEDWYDPAAGVHIAGDHVEFYSVLLDDFAEPFMQTEGDLYWLVLGTPPDLDVGWKSALVGHGEGENPAVFFDLHGVGWAAMGVPPDGEVPMALAFEIVGIPEPASVLLVGTGLLAALGVIRRRRMR